MDFARIINVDFDKKEGKIKPLTGLNSGPVLFARSLRYDISDKFSEMSVSTVRICDVEPPYGKNQFVDIHCLFPSFSADETLPESYNFTETDKYVTAAAKTGAQIIFRLGESLDPYERKLYVGAPSDVEKWARICEHIILHYNEGFADGFKLKIRYWEIWNMPELPEGWMGEESEFFAFYSCVASYLKERFPKLKFGGYGSLGFSAFNRLAVDGALAEAPQYAERFLGYIATEKAPLDFFTWYCVADTPEEVSLHAQYARNLLDRMGYRRAASFIVGFNLESASSGERVGYLTTHLASLITAQRGAVDMLIYDDARPDASNNLVYTLNAGEVEMGPASYALSAFSSLLLRGSAVESLGDSRREIYSLAARGTDSAALLIVSAEFSGRIDVKLKGADFRAFSVKRFAEDERGAVRVGVRRDIPLSGNKLTLSFEKNDVYLLEFDK